MSGVNLCDLYPWMPPAGGTVLHTHRQREIVALADPDRDGPCSGMAAFWYRQRRPIEGCKAAYAYDQTHVAMRFYRTSENVHVALQELSLSERVAIRTTGDELVTIRIMLAGLSRFMGSGYDPIDMQGPLVTVHPHHQDEVLQHDVAAGKQRVLTVIACPEMLRGELGWSLGDVAGPVLLPLTPAVEKIANELAGNRFDGARHETFVRARTLDLLCTLATEWDSAAPCESERLALTMRDRERIHALREMLEDTAHRPPSIAQLARQAGMNKSKLMRGFKQIFGETIADFCRRVRLEEARALLLADRLTIGEIAAAVGYQHQSSFTTAFSAHFGVPPKALLRGAPTRRAA